MYRFDGCDTARVAAPGGALPVKGRSSTSTGDGSQPTGRPTQRGGPHTVNGVPGWTYFGRTCVGDEVPGAERLPSMLMIQEAFHRTPWATASLGFQPAKNRTYVNLVNFYSANWSTSGFGPGEVDAIDPALMFGHRVEIRPKLANLVYHFGDGQSEGPTTSLGGKAPNGDVRHVYKKSGTYNAYVTVTWGADFRIDGGAWLDIDDTVAVDQPASTITALQARARLQFN